MNARSIAIIVVVLIAAGLGYAYMQKNAASTTDVSTPPTSKHAVAWKFTDMGENAEAMPSTKVEVIIDGHIYDAGTYTGSCSEIGASGGVDGKGLLSGEVAGAQCWFAGGGDEIGVFEENGALTIRKGQLDEGTAEIAGFRGNFTTLLTVSN